VHAQPQSASPPALAAPAVRPAARADADAAPSLTRRCPASRRAGGFAASTWLAANLAPLISKTFTPGNAAKARAAAAHRASHA
jgi:hypothetical protein